MIQGEPSKRRHNCRPCDQQEVLPAPDESAPQTNATERSQGAHERHVPHNCKRQGCRQPAQRIRLGCSRNAYSKCPRKRSHMGRKQHQATPIACPSRPAKQQAPRWACIKCAGEDCKVAARLNTANTVPTDHNQEPEESAYLTEMHTP